MATKMPVAGAGAAVTAAAAAPHHLPRIVVTEDGRRMRLVDDETMTYFLSLPLSPPLICTYSPELMRRLGLDDGEVDTLLRAYRSAERTHGIQVDVLRQYNARGYAYLEIPELYPDDHDDDMDDDQQHTMEEIN